MFFVILKLTDVKIPIAIKLASNPLFFVLGKHTFIYFSFTWHAYPISWHLPRFYLPEIYFAIIPDQF